jgi:arylsulfatase A-like enzyme
LSRQLGLLVVVTFVAGGLAPTQSVAVPQPPVATPNILVLVTDDQTWANFTRELMPKTFSGLVDRGVLFDRAYDASSLCCPSRAELLTGLFESHTGVDDNSVPLNRFTIVDALHDIGYRTSLAGKWLNSEPCDPQPNFDQWVCAGAGRSSYSLVNPTLNVNGSWVSFTGYQTDILADYTVDFVESTPSDQPFFAMYTPTSPHLPANDDRCSTIPVSPYRPPSYDEDTQTDGKPMYVARPPLGKMEKTQIDADHKLMTRAVPCLDASIGSVLDGLDASGRAEETMVVFLSDNGFLFGEHRRWNKEVPYQEASHVPMVIRYPPLVPEDQPFTTSALAENVDIAATIADIVGIHWGADGLSLAPVLDGSATAVRGGALIQHCQGANAPCTPPILPFNMSSAPSSNAIITDQYSYIEHVTGETELYDLAADPYEMRNASGDPGYAEVEAQLAADLAALLAPPETDTTIVSGPEGALSTRMASFTFFSQSRLASYECRLERDAWQGPWTPCNRDGVSVGPFDDGTYTFLVRGTDEHGVTDATPASRSLSVTSTGPDITITSSPSVHTQESSLTYEFSSDTPGATYECTIGLVGTSESWTPCAPPGVTYGPLSDGSWVFQVRAIDGSGVASAPAAAARTRVDNAGPQVTFSLSPSKWTRLTAASFRFFANEPLLAGLDCSLDGLPAVDCTSGIFGTADLALGAHTLTVTGSDELGLTATTMYPWTIDASPPKLTITGPPAYSNQQTSTVTITPDESLDSTGPTCALDGENLLVGIYLKSGCEKGSVVVRKLTEGLHTFQAAGTDQAGNLSSIVTYTWIVDTIAPVTTIESGPSDPSTQTHAVFQFSAVDASPVTFTCSLDGAPPVPCASGVRVRNLSLGTHTFSIWGTDAATNVSHPVTWAWSVIGA